MEHDYLVMINNGLESCMTVNVYTDSEISAIISALRSIEYKVPRPHVYNVEVLT